ncbi:hypothetical protein Y032_0058g2853 [Ancylostoma ceylanicum]|nr:hypothetical protein Y032_0058g2853 [Ancylostoma ceylanicum]
MIRIDRHVRSPWIAAKRSSSPRHPSHYRHHSHRHFIPQKEHGVYTVFVELPNSKLELLHPLGEKSPIQGFLDKNKGGGMHHICIEVNNIAKAMQTVKANGIRTLGEKPKIGAHGKDVIFLHPKDCGGVLIELEQE